MSFTVSATPGLDAGEGYILIDNLKLPGTPYYTHYNIILSHSNGRNILREIIDTVSISSINLKIPYLYNDSYSLSITHTGDGYEIPNPNVPNKIVVSGSSVQNLGDITATLVGHTDASRANNGSITIHATGGTGHLTVSLSSNSTSTRYYSLPYDTDYTISDLTQQTADIKYSLTITDRDTSFPAFSIPLGVTVKAYNGCRLLLGAVQELVSSSSPGSATVSLYNAQPATAPFYAQVRQKGGAWVIPATLLSTIAVVPYPQSFQLKGLYNGSYELQVYDSATTPCSTDIVGFSIAQGVDPPDPCDLKIKCTSTPPTKSGVNDGTVSVTLTGTQGLETTVQLLQDSVVQYEFIVPATQATQATGTFTGVLPGTYTPTARISANCASKPQETSDISVDPPPLSIGDQLTFLPWVQPKLQHAATGNTLKLGATLRTDQGTTQPTTDVVATTYGPADVLGINQGALLTTTPAPGAVGFSPLQLAAIDFKDEDLPWRYSSLKIAEVPATGTTPLVPAVPLPWCMLLVLAADEFEALPLAGAPLPGVRLKAILPGGATTKVPSKAFPSPDPQQQQLWAHVQLNAPLGTVDPDYPKKRLQPTEAQITTFFKDVLPKSPDLAYSRVFCPRRLAENTAYTAVLVPAVEAGRLAGLGRAYTAGDVTKSAIPAATTTDDVDFPVYYQWKFVTGSADDFESLVQQLHPANETTRTATAPGLTLTTPTGTTYQLPLVGALMDGAAPTPTTPDPTDKSALEVAQYVYGQLKPGRSLSGRPFVAAPLYGRAYLITPDLTLPTSAAADSWKFTLNLDPRYRVLAAVGADVVRDNQEEYVRRAWDQVQDILLANEKLRGAQYGLRTTAGLRDQHLPVNITITTTTTTSGSGTGKLMASSEVASDEATSSEAANYEATSDEAASSEAATFSRQALAEEALGADAPQVSTATGLADYGLHLTGPSMRRVRVSTAQPTITVREAIRRSSTPLAAFSPTFRRISKPFGNYQVGQAGRPLRPTQAEPALDPTDLRTTGTSLRQRDVLLTRLSEEKLAAAPVYAEELRVYQFADDVVDPYLAASVAPAGQAAPVSLPAPASLSGDAVARFGLAYRAFATQAEATADITAVGFRRPQHVRPRLKLDAIKQDMVEGTRPERGWLARLDKVAPAATPPPSVPSTGDFEAPDFNASHFYVGDFDEPSHLANGDWLPADFAPADFLVPHLVWDYEEPIPTSPPIVEQPAPVEELPVAPTSALRLRTTLAAAEEASLTAFSSSPASLGSTTSTVTTTSALAPTTDAGLPVIKQVKAVPVFKEAMGEALRQRHPELFVPGVGDFPTGGVAVLDVNQAFVEAYMVGLNHALGSELSWRGFPVDLRGTFFQQFWDVSEHFNTSLADPTAQPSASQEAAMVDIKPLDKWLTKQLGKNAQVEPQPGTTTLRLALRSELLRRYPTLILALQDATAADPTDPAGFLHPTQRLAVGLDVVVVTFAVSQQYALDHCALVLMERPGQPTFGLDGDPTADPTRDPAGWSDLTWEYAGTAVNENFTPTPTGATGSKPHAAAETPSVAYLTDSANVAYALFQEPIMAFIPVSSFLQ